MSNSRRYNTLLLRVARLEKNFLPQEKVAGNYTVKEMDSIRAYVVLVHAEIESYFEDIAIDKANKAVKNWRDNKKISMVLSNIIAFISPQMNWTKNDGLDYRISRSASHYLNMIESNHGIKADNLKNILYPIGFEEDQFDSTWILTMDSFGSFRGHIAHSSHGVQSQIDMRTERDRINNIIIPEIKGIDEDLRRLR